MLINDPDADSTFKTVELATNRRFSHGWQFSAGFTATKIDMPYTARLAFNPNAEINAANRTWEWEGKLSGGYVLPYAIMLSANFEHRSGAPQARQVLFTGGRQIRSILLNVEPIGSLRLPSTNMLDFRAGKRIPLPKARALELRADVFNALNINTVVTRILQSGSTYLVPSQIGETRPILLPRILQLGLAFSF